MNSYGAYKNVRDAAWQVLVRHNASELPIQVVSIANNSGITVIQNKEVNELKSNEIGVSVYDGEKWYIIYDSTMQKARIRFTLAHELGHIFLGHPTKDGYHARTIDTDRQNVEREADAFASRLLMPSCVIWGLGLHSAEEIRDTCGVSFEAAKIRMERMNTLYQRNKFLTSSLERQVYKNFEHYISNHRKTT